mgnify:CR=1 FL=1
MIFMILQIKNLAHTKKELQEMKDHWEGRMKYVVLSSILVGCSGELAESSYERTTDVERETISMRVDFGEDGDSDWIPVNDTVMGGESVGTVEYTAGSALFKGRVSTDNNGGFVSLRSPVASYDLSDFTEVEISYKAQGHNFKMVLADSVAWWKPTFEAVIAPETDEWTTTTISLYDFSLLTLILFKKVYILNNSKSGCEIGTQALSFSNGHLATKPF